jgi:hypothetical protein
MFLFCSQLDKQKGSSRFVYIPLASQRRLLDFNLASQFHHTVAGQFEKFHRISRIPQHPCKHLFPPNRHAGDFGRN